MHVHAVLGPGLLESAYQGCLAHELRKRGLEVVSQVGLPVVYDGEDRTRVPDGLGGREPRHRRG